MSSRSKAPDNEAAEMALAHSVGNKVEPLLREQFGQPPVEQPNMLLCPEPAKAKRQRDPELVAMERILRVMEELKPDQQTRVYYFLLHKSGLIQTKFQEPSPDAPRG